MPLLADYAITPDVFDETSYSSGEVCAARLETIREAMLDEGLVRDLRDGRWAAIFKSGDRPWHRRGLELVKKLAKQGRLIRHRPALADSPRDDQSWCAEALASHAVRPLGGGIIATEPVKKVYAREPLVSPIDRLSSATWWAARSPSVRLQRTLTDYQKHLDPILRCSNSILFIDPHLDPTKRQYRDFGTLLAHSGRRKPAPTIEIHRVCYKGPPRERKILNVGELARDFRRALGPELRTAGLRAEVFVWDAFHDRFLISNLIGISLPYGFDTGGSHQHTLWTRLGRKNSDDVQREFDQASGQHALRGRFRIP